MRRSRLSGAGPPAYILWRPTCRRAGNHECTLVFDWRCVFPSPLWILDLQGLTTDEPLQRRDPGLVLLQKISCLSLFVELTRLILGDPNPNQVARDVVAPRKTIQGLSTEKLLCILTLELNAVGTVFGHGFPSKRKPDRLNSLPYTVHSQRRTPMVGQFSMPIDTLGKTRFPTAH